MDQATQGALRDGGTPEPGVGGCRVQGFAPGRWKRTPGSRACPGLSLERVRVPGHVAGRRPPALAVSPRGLLPSPLSFSLSLLFPGRTAVPRPALTRWMLSLRRENPQADPPRCWPRSITPLSQSGLSLPPSCLSQEPKSQEGAVQAPAGDPTDLRTPLGSISRSYAPVQPDPG